MSSIGHRALVGHDRDRRALLEPGEVAVGPGAEGLLDELDAERDDLGHQALRVVACPAGVGVDADRTGEDATDGPERLEVLRAAELDLEGREVGRPGGSFGDHVGLVDADREVGRRDRARQVEQPMDREAEDLAGEVVDGDVEGALGPAIPAQVVRPGPAEPLERRARRGRVRQLVHEPVRERQEIREDRGHRLRRLAVEPVRVALPDPDDPREPVVGQLDDDGRHRDASA